MLETGTSGCVSSEGWRVQWGIKTHRGKSQKPRSLDSREEGNQISETYRQHHPWGDGEPSGRNESERIGGLESAFPGAEPSTGG